MVLTLLNISLCLLAEV